MFGIWLVVAAAQLYRSFSFTQVAAIGIIGGADGPTSIIMNNPAASNDYMVAFIGSIPLLIATVLAIMLVAAVVIILVRKRHKNK